MALRWASDLARALGVSVVPVIVGESEEGLEAFVKDNAHGDVAEVVTAEGDAADQLRRMGDELDASLIVVGARGRGALRRTVLGSTTARLIEQSTRPVAVVRRSARLKSRRRKSAIVAATDGSPLGTAAVVWAADVARAARAELIVFHAFDYDQSEVRPEQGDRLTDDARERVERTFKSLIEEPYELVAAEGDATEALERFSAERKPVMVVLGSQGLSGVREAFVGSVANHAVQRLTAPVVLIPEPARVSA